MRVKDASFNVLRRRFDIRLTEAKIGKTLEEFEESFKNRMFETLRLFSHVFLYGVDFEEGDEEHVEGFKFLSTLIRENCQDHSIWFISDLEIDEIPEYVKGEVDFIRTGVFKGEDHYNDLFEGVCFLDTNNQKILKKNTDY